MSDTDLDAAVSEFLETADTVLAEYDQGYMDADAALAVLESRIADLRDAHDETVHQ